MGLTLRSVLVVIMPVFAALPLAGQDNVYTNTIGMEFVRIPPGEMLVGKFKPPYPVPADTVKGATRDVVMWMGDGRPYNAGEFRLAKTLALVDAMPGFVVTIHKPYYIGRYEVTQAEWEEVMGTNPSVFQGGDIEQGDRHPVENVSWSDAKEFLRRLSEREPGKTYRLPTEFEWEWAASAGADGDITWDAARQMAQLGGMTTYVVGRKEPNAWGLYDVLGNVWEWVEDYYNEKIFADPKPPTTGSTHVLKGASFAGDVKNATWLTHAGGPGNGWDVGFRVVLEIDENTAK